MRVAQQLHAVSRMALTLLPAVFLLIAPNAYAQVGDGCISDEDCPEGAICSEGICLPNECDDSGACAEGFVCAVYVSESCSGSVDDAEPPVDEDGSTDGSGDDSGEGSGGSTDIDQATGEEGEAEEEESCVSEEVALCVPSYVAPCSADADCGEGFACVAEESCSCSGSTGGSDDGTDPDDGDEGGSTEIDQAEEDCSCEPTGETYCELLYTSCTADEECGGDWTCETDDDDAAETPDSVDVDGETDDGESEEPGSDEGDSSGGSTDIDQSSEDGNVSGYCVPAGWDDWSEDAHSEDERQNSDGGSTGDSSDPTAAGDDSGSSSAAAASDDISCQAVPTSLFALLPLLGLLRRRRR